MEEKKIVHLGVTGVLLIIAIIAMAIEGVIIWKMNVKHYDSNQEITNLKQRIDSLSVSNNELKETLNRIDSTTNISSLKNESEDEIVGLNFSRFFIDQWHQVAGIDIYWFSSSLDGDLIERNSVPLGDPNYMDTEFNVKYEYDKLSSKLNNIAGITGLYKIDENNLEGSPSIDCIIIKYQDNTYGLLDLNGNNQVRVTNPEEIKQKIKDYNNIAQKYGMSEYNMNRLVF